MMIFVSMLSWIGVRLLSWLVGRLIGSAISFQLAGLYHLTNVSIQFPKGWIAAVVIGGVKIVAAAPSRPTTDGTTLQDHKRQLLISHLEVLFRGLKHQGRLDDDHDPHMTHMNSSSSSHRHWVILTKIAKYFNFSISELVLKYIEMPKVSMEIKLLEFHVHREPGASNSVWTKLLIQLCTIYVGEKQSLVEDSSISKFQRMFTGTRTLQLPAPEIVPESTYFVCFFLDHLSTTCYVDDHDRYISLDNVQMSDLMATVQGNVASGLCGFKSVETVAYLPSQKPKDLTPTDTLGWQIVMGAIPLLYFGNCCCMGLDARAGREHGVVIQQMQLNCGDVFLELNEELLLGESGLVGAQKSSCIPTSTTAFSSNNVPVYENQPAPTCSHDQEENADCTRAVKLPEKLGFNLGKLSVKCSYKDGVMENQVRGIQLLGGKSHGYETIAASNQLTLLDIHMSCDEILV
ncbi:unnamed protein product [Sphagnum balticum]